MKRGALGLVVRPDSPRSAAATRSTAGSPGRVSSRLELSAGELFLIGATLLFLTISAWWVSVDGRVPDPDNGRHLLLSFGYLDKIRGGELLAPLTEWHEYVPLVHLVGALGSAIGGKSVAAAVIAENLVFLPLLALGCYGAGRVAFDRRVGVLAAVFALAVPMVVSVFHVLMLDGPEAALVAASVWLLLASERFASLKYSLLAAAAVIFGLYSKQTFAFFVAGLIAVMLLRGGWRHWKNFSAFAAAVLVFALPWYLLHYSDLRGQAEGAVTGGGTLWYDGVPYPSRWSIDSFTWYAWNFVNNQVYLPLALFFLVGLGVALWIVVRRRAEAGFLPELIAGVAFAYLTLSLKYLDDPRYTLPFLVYVALIGTFWIARVRAPFALAASAVLIAVFFVNLFTISFGKGDVLVIDTPRSVDSPIQQWKLVVLNPGGYIAGAPDRDGTGGDLVDAFERARAMGFESVAFEPQSFAASGFHLHGLGALAAAAGLEYAGDKPEILSANGISVFRAAPGQVREQEPCVISDADGSGIFFAAGPLPNAPLFCPPST
jgi:hypothetical protein